VVQIELFGVARLRAQRAELSVAAHSIGDALRALETACPALSPSVVSDGELSDSYLVALNGRVLDRSANPELGAGDVLLIMSAQAGG
jgi:molybdopterin converting factor small subunit